MHAHETEFGRSHTEVAKTESDVVEPELGEEPGALRVGREELHNGFEVDVGLLVVHADDLRLAVGDELFCLCFGEECHFVDSLVCADPNGPVTKARGHEGPLKESMTLETKQADLPQDVATDEVREASRARAPDSPVPGEHRDV